MSDQNVNPYISLKELDAFVFKNIMGLSSAGDIPKYSDSLPDAFHVIEKLSEYGFYFTLTERPLLWDAKFENPRCTVSIQSKAATVAIVRAAVFIWKMNIEILASE